MKQADRIIAHFGGLTKMAAALGHRHPSTVQGWRDRGYIPANRQQEVLDRARELSIPLQPADFFDSEEE